MYFLIKEIGKVIEIPSIGTVIDNRKMPQAFVGLDSSVQILETKMSCKNIFRKKKQRIENIVEKNKMKLRILNAKKKYMRNSTYFDQEQQDAIKKILMIGLVLHGRITGEGRNADSNGNPVEVEEPVEEYELAMTSVKQVDPAPVRLKDVEVEAEAEAEAEAEVESVVENVFEVDEEHDQNSEKILSDRIFAAILEKTCFKSVLDILEEDFKKRLPWSIVDVKMGGC